MSETVKQWPDNITSGDIRYGKASNYDGFYLADVDHGIPTFCSVSDSAVPTIRGQHVNVFNYPGQTEAIAAELVKRWNAYSGLLEALKELLELTDDHDNDADPEESTFVFARAAIAKAEGRK